MKSKDFEKSFFCFAAPVTFPRDRAGYSEAGRAVCRLPPGPPTTRKLGQLGETGGALAHAYHSQVFLRVWVSV